MLPMSRSPKRPRNLNRWAKRMVDIDTGEACDREPTPKDLASCLRRDRPARRVSLSAWIRLPRRPMLHWQKTGERGDGAGEYFGERS
jgi:hypothetical protein